MTLFSWKKESIKKKCKKYMLYSEILSYCVDAYVLSENDMLFKDSFLTKWASLQGWKKKKKGISQTGFFCPMVLWKKLEHKHGSELQSLQSAHEMSELCASFKSGLKIVQPRWPPICNLTASPITCNLSPVFGFCTSVSDVWWNVGQNPLKFYYPQLQCEFC